MCSTGEIKYLLVIAHKYWVKFKRIGKEFHGTIPIILPEKSK